MNRFMAYLESLDQTPTVQAASELYKNETPDDSVSVKSEEIHQGQPIEPVGPHPLNDKEINNLCCELESIWKRTHHFAPILRAIKDSGVQYLGQGSSRMVFKLNDDKVLKLAKNKKGLDQNCAEANYYLRQIYGIAEWFLASNDDIWIVSELCTKAKASDFKKKLGISFKDYCNYVEYIAQERGTKRRYGKIDPPPNVEQYMEAENLLGGINEYIANMDPPIGDLTKLNSYGITKTGDIVLVDTGLTDDIEERYYKPR